MTTKRKLHKERKRAKVKARKKEFLNKQLEKKIGQGMFINDLAKGCRGWM